MKKVLLPCFLLLFFATCKKEPLITNIPTSYTMLCSLGLAVWCGLGLFIPHGSRYIGGRQVSLIT